MNSYNLSFYTEKKIIFNIIDVYTNTYNVFLGTNDFFHSNDETNKLLIQTVIHNKELNEVIYFLPSGTQEEILSGDMSRLNNKKKNNI